MTENSSYPLLEIEDLQVNFTIRRGIVQGVRGATIRIDRGETLGLVGESGSGKSVTFEAVLGLINAPGEIVGGDIRWKGRSLLGPNGERYARSIRGKEMALVFQDPMTSLNPVFTVGFQITEVLKHHMGMGGKQARGRAVELLTLVAINAPSTRLSQYPHELSGGMRQRVMIAMSLACEPELLIADEPTTALDVTIQAQILELLAELQQRLNLSVIMITHDLGVIAGLCHRVAVMYGGKIVETGRVDDLFARPAHPYTMGLLRSTPRLDQARGQLVAIDGAPPDMIAPPLGCAFHPRCPQATSQCEQQPPLTATEGERQVACWHASIPSSVHRDKGEDTAAGSKTKGAKAEGATGGENGAKPLVKVEGLTVDFNVGRAGFWGQHKLILNAVDNVSLEIFPGETLGLVGESGSGKTTTGRAILRRLPLTKGRIFFKGQEITGVKGEELRRLRKHMQLIFQDPYASLNPRMRVLDIVAEPLVVHGLVKSAKDAAEQVTELLRLVGLPADAGSRYPHAFSGGQRQRVGIARTLALQPEFIVADEPVSALDVSIRAQVVNLMLDLQQELNLTYLLIAHDLSIVRHASHRIAIMYAGRLVEIASKDAIYENPTHPYTEALLSAVPIPDPVLQRSRRRIAIPGEIPDPMNPPPGCRFHTRCQYVTAQCRAEEPLLELRGQGQRVACWNR